MKIADFYTQIAKRADTDKTKINAAECNRVLSCMFDVLNGLSAADATDTIAKGLALAAKRAAK